MSVGAAGSEAATLYVTKTDDFGQPGTLRAAIEAARDGDTVDATGVTGTIYLHGDTLSIGYSISIVGPGADLLAVNSEHLASARQHAFRTGELPDHNPATHHLTVSISGLTITGSAGGGFPGGGISNSKCDLTLTNCKITGNSSALGGGIFNADTGALRIIGCTIRDNVAAQRGGAIYSEASSGGAVVGTPAIQIINSSVSGIADDGYPGPADGEGGAIYSEAATIEIVDSTISGRGQLRGGCIYHAPVGTGTLKIVNSTITRGFSEKGAAIYNDASQGVAFVQLLSSTLFENFTSVHGGIYNAGGTVELGSTILHSSLGENIYNDAGAVTSLGYNLATDGGVTNANGGTGALSATGDLPNRDPKLGLSCSPAIDQGKNFSNSLFDQRGSGFVRTFDNPNIPQPGGGDGTDIGAIELQGVIDSVLVTNTDDDGAGSLRQALRDANSCPGPSVITLAPSASGTITLTSGALLLTEEVTIKGPGASNVTLSGNNSSRVFIITPGIKAELSGITIANCLAADAFPGLGGGIHNRGDLTLQGCRITGNVADYFGGGIYNDGTSGVAKLELINTTIDSNYSALGGALCGAGGASGSSIVKLTNSTLNGNAADDGGAIYNDGSNGPATVEIANSTLSGNSAASGGGIYNAAGVLRLRNSTIHDNTGAPGGGIYNNGQSGSATVELRSTILSSSALENASGTVTSHGYNLSSDNAGGFLTATGDQTNVNPLLGPLADNGGPTRTHNPAIGSPAIDKGRAFGLSFDQRGDLRTIDSPSLSNASLGDGTDVGAVEFRPTSGSDTDGDGTSDDFEVFHGFNPIDPADGGNDADGDGHTNTQEYQAGTDPRDAQSRLQITAVTKIGTHLDVTFGTVVVGKTYRLERTNALTDPNWSAVSGLSDFIPATTTAVADLTHPVAFGLQQFYRIRLVP